MKCTILGLGKNIAHINDSEKITDVQSALDLIATVNYETGCNQLVMDKSCFPEDSFVLSSGLAGEILQKFVNYHVKVAIVGDYSVYTSKPLKDFIYESNKGNHVFFVSTLEEAVSKLENAK